MSGQELRNRKTEVSATTSASSPKPSSSVTTPLPPRRHDEFRPGAGPSADSLAQVQNRNFIGGLVFALLLALLFLYPKIKEEYDNGTLWPPQSRHFTIHI